MNGLYKPPPAHVSWLSRYLPPSPIEFVFLSTTRIVMITRRGTCLSKSNKSIPIREIWQGLMYYYSLLTCQEAIQFRKDSHRRVVWSMCLLRHKRTCAWQRARPTRPLPLATCGTRLCRAISTCPDNELILESLILKNYLLITIRFNDYPK